MGSCIDSIENGIKDLDIVYGSLVRSFKILWAARCLQNNNSCNDLYASRWMQILLAQVERHFRGRLYLSLSF